MTWARKERLASRLDPLEADTRLNDELPQRRQDHSAADLAALDAAGASAICD